MNGTSVQSTLQNFFAAIGNQVGSLLGISGPIRSGEMRYFAMPGLKIDNRAISAVYIENGFVRGDVFNKPSVRIAVGSLGTHRRAQLSKILVFGGDDALIAIHALKTSAYFDESEHTQFTRRLSEVRQAFEQAKSLELARANGIRRIPIPAPVSSDAEQSVAAVSNRQR